MKTQPQQSTVVSNETKTPIQRNRILYPTDESVKKPTRSRISLTSNIPTDYQSKPSSGIFTFPVNLSNNYSKREQDKPPSSQGPIGLEDMDIWQVKQEYKKAEEEHQQRLEKQAKTIMKSHNGNAYVNYGNSKIYVGDDIVQQLDRSSEFADPVMKQSPTGNFYTTYGDSKFYVEDNIAEKYRTPRLIRPKK